MIRFLVMGVAVAALSGASVSAALAVEEQAKTKTQVLGHMSDKNMPANTEDEEATAPEPKKDPSFIPVSKLGKYPDEVASPEINIRTRSEGGEEKLRNLP